MAPKTRKPFWRQLRWSLISAFILLAVLPVLLVVGLTLPRLQQQARDQTTDQLQALADIKQEQLAHWLEDGGLVLDVFLADPTEKKLLTDFAAASRPQDSPLAPTALGRDTRQNTINSLLSSTTQAQNIFEELFLYNASGQIIAASPPGLVGRVVSRRPYFAPSLRGNYVQPPYYEIGVEGLTTLITRPLPDAGGQTVGVLAGRLKMSTLGQIMTRSTGQGRTGETYLVSQESNYLVTPSRFAAEGYGLTRAYYSEGIERALQGQNGAGLYGNYHQPPVPVIGVYRWLPELQVGLLAEVAEAEALTAFTLTRNFSLGVALASALVAALLGFYTANRIARPIADLTRVAQALGRGDYDQRANVRTGDEVETLGQAFNQMAADIQQAQAGLTASEARFRELVEQAADGIFITDAQGTFIEVNSSGCQMLGYSWEEILRLHLRDVISPEDLAANPLKWAELQSGQTLLLERRLKRQDGTLIPVEISAKMLPDGRLQGIVRDITERKRAEAAIRASEERFRQITETIREVFYVSYLDTPQMFYISPGYEEIWGRSRETLYANPFSFLESIHADDRQRIREALARQLEGLETEEEYRIWRPDGSMRWIRDRAFPVHEASGRVHRVTGIAEDITERKQAEDQLRDSEEQYRHLFAVAPDAIFFADAETLQILDVNQAAARMYGYSPQEFLRLRVTDVSAEPEATRQALRQRLAEIPLRYHRHKDGTTFPVEGNTITFFWRGRWVHLGVFRDITARLQAEEALKAYSERLEEMVGARTQALRDAQERLLRQEKLATIGQISASIAHELRNPLGAIKQSAFYLQRLYFRDQLTVANPKVKEHLDLIRVEIDTSDRVISDLLEMTRAKVPQPGRIELRPLIVEAVERANLAGVLQLQFDLNPEPFIFWADPMQMRQVLINLLTNADQAGTENGQVMISARWLPAEAQVQIQIQDNGCGIEVGVIDKVFEPLYTTKAKGTGLGLSICKQIIEGHGGQITLRSQIKQGTTVEIRLPQPPA